MIEKRTIGDSGIEVAPLALGGNVFGWTADEKTSFDVLDAFVDAGGTMIDTADVYSAWVPGHQGGESETVIGRWLKRDPAKRDKVVIATKVGFMAGLGAGDDRARLRRLAAAARDRDDRPLLPSQGRPGRPARRQPRRDGRAGEGREGARRRPVAIFGRAAGGSDADRERERSARGRARSRPGTIWSSARSSKGRCATSRSPTGSASFPFYGLANGFLTGKYRSQEDLGKSTRGDRVSGYLEGKGMRVLEALDEVHAETGAPLAAIALAWTNAQPGIVATLGQRDERRAAEGTDRRDETSSSARDSSRVLDEASAETEPRTGLSSDRGLAEPAPSRRAAIRSAAWA